VAEKLALFHPPQISHEVMTWDGTCGSAARSQLWHNQKDAKIAQIEIKGDNVRCAVYIHILKHIACSRIHVS
jgi:hypothetical protein